MTHKDLEVMVADFTKSYGESPRRIELPPDEYQDLAKDLWSGLVPVEFSLNGITILAGQPGVFTIASAGIVTSGFIARKASAPKCDCGATKTNQPGHSWFCSTQKVSA